MEIPETGSDVLAPEEGYAPSPEPKKSRVPLFVGLAVLLLIAVIAAVALIKFLPLLLGGKPSAPQLMPADMTFYTSVKADLGDLEGLKHLAEVYGDVGAVQDALDELQDDLDDTAGITWKDDIQPWLGTEVAIAISDLQTVYTGYELPTFIIMAQTRSRSASDDFVEKVIELLEEEEWKISEQNHEGMDYYLLEPPALGYYPDLCLGTVKGFLVLVTDEDAMEEVIDASKDRADSLADNPRFSDVMAVLPSDAVAYAVVDMHEMMDTAMDTLERDLAYGGIYLPSEITDLSEAYDAYGLAVGLHEDGVQMDLVVSFDPDRIDTEIFQFYQAGASANRILDRIPENAVGFYSGQNLAEAWRAAYKLLSGMPDGEEQMEVLAEESGIQLDRELLSWASGEFAIAAVQSDSLEGLDFGGFAVFEVDDQEKAQALLHDILGLLDQFGNIEIAQDTIDGVDMTLIIDAWGGEVVFGYGFDDGHLLIGLGADGMKQSVGDARSITGDDMFKAVRKRLPSKASGYLYVNLEAAMSVALDTMSEWEREDYMEYTEPYLKPIKAIGAVSEPMETGETIAHATLFFYIP